MLFCDSQKLELWFGQAVGKELLAQEQTLLDNWLETLFGYHLLQLSVCDQQVLYQSSKIKHKFCLSEQQGQGLAVTDFQSLPLQSESVDVVLLHHVLDYTENPHALLREAARVLLPGGHIIVLGFNPFSPLAILNCCPKLSSTSCFSASRVGDWLSLLEFSNPTLHFGFYKLPFTRCCQGHETPWYFRLPEKKQWPLGGFYGLLARKQPMTITPIMPKRKQPTLGLGVKPSICKDLKHKDIHDPR